MQLQNLNLLEMEISHSDEHNLQLYFGPSILHASKYSIPNNFFHDSSYDLILDFFMVFIKDHSSFVPLLECRSHPIGSSSFVNYFPKSFYLSIILSNESLPMDYFDKVDASILTSFINSMYIDDVAYLLIFKQLEDGNHMHTKKSIAIDISDDLAHPKIVYLGDV